MKGTLYLIPNTLGNPDPRLTIPESVSRLATRLSVFIVEDLRNARRYLKKLDPDLDIDALKFHIMNEHTPDGELHGMLTELMQGDSAGIISEAGMPGIADPGAKLVKLAHENDIRVLPLTGPSSIMMALMASGLNGQQFRFLGYLPVKKPERIKMLVELDRIISGSHETQIFIETPYRNNALFDDIVKHCNPATLLTIALDISLESEEIHTWSIGTWKAKKPELHKRPAVFLLGES
ncbi:MAG: SAM-dependent methyltransferase [Bacteroidales bacterium]|nr:SAM-dependent methyltransferase [Bacteroidales bacterium]MBN2697875.1 SAM-dependent methyltransferase [Bacteroidales bacterium]